MKNDRKKKWWKHGRDELLLMAGQGLWRRKGKFVWGTIRLSPGVYRFKRSLPEARVLCTSSYFFLEKNFSLCIPL